MTDDEFQHLRYSLNNHRWAGLIHEVFRLWHDEATWCRNAATVYFVDKQYPEYRVFLRASDWIDARMRDTAAEPSKITKSRLTQGFGNELLGFMFNAFRVEYPDPD